MRTSRYFADLRRAYADEIDDLLTDSDGRTVLRQRLDVKRRQFDAILPMIEFSPEMVVAAFYDAFRFPSAALMQQIAQSEPGAPDFVDWSELATQLTVADWAVPLVAAAHKVDGGDTFLVTAATLEYLRNARGAAPLADAVETTHGARGGAYGDESEHDEYSEGDANDDGDDAEDLAEAGADWLAEQGFETPGH